MFKWKPGLKKNQENMIETYVSSVISQNWGDGSDQKVVTSSFNQIEKLAKLENSNVLKKKWH